MQHLFPSHSQWWLSSHTIRIFLVNCFRNTQQRKTKLIYSHQGVLFNFHCGGGVISLISYTYCFNNEVTKLRTPYLIISGATTDCWASVHVEGGILIKCCKEKGSKRLIYVHKAICSSSDHRNGVSGITLFCYLFKRFKLDYEMRRECPNLVTQQEATI